MPTSGSTQVNVGSAKRDFTATITGQTGIGAGSLVEAFLMPVATADKSVDDQMIDNITVQAGNIVAGVGFDVNISARIGFVHGTYNIGWVYT